MISEKLFFKTNRFLACQLNVFICPIPFFVAKKNIFIENILMEN